MNLRVGTIGLLAGLALAAAPAAAVNLISNGNFESGNTGFTSQYTYTVPGPGNLYPESVYTVDNNPNNSHDQFSSFGDHTSGEGLFMIINGAGTANDTVWGSQPINLVAGTSYTFSFWLVSAHPSSPALLSLAFADDNGPISFGPFAASATTGLWLQYSASFTATTNGAVNFAIVNQNTELSGNDFGIDDISLTANAIPEPATWAMLLAGFGLIGMAARRRRTQAA